MNFISTKKIEFVDFKCEQDCSQCCIEREYYPSKKFGKIGVLILPQEKKQIEAFATECGLDVLILPRIGISKNVSDEPTIIAYQMMGREENGNTCPFLDTNNSERSPHGGYLCKIYQKRPLACKAYPLIESNPITLDSKCKFCQNHGQATANLDSELESLAKIQSNLSIDSKYIWRYATGISEEQDKDLVELGWILEANP